MIEGHSAHPLVGDEVNCARMNNGSERLEGHL